MKSNTVNLSEFLSLSNERGGLVRLADAAILLGVSRTRAYQLVAAGRLPCFCLLGVKYAPCDCIRKRRAVRRVAAGRALNLVTL